MTESQNSLIQLIDFPLKHDERGDLVIAEVGRQVPFDINRIFYIFNTEDGGKRGFHAHKKNRIVLIALRGSSIIKLDNGRNKEEVLLDCPNQGLVLEPEVWHSMEEFKKDTVLLVLASELYDEDDYLRDYDEFINYIQDK